LFGKRNRLKRSKPRIKLAIEYRANTYFVKERKMLGAIQK
jgi:hypothetical protein